MKSYTLNTEDIEMMLQSQFGPKIEPVNQSKLLQLKRQQQRAKQAALLFKNKK